MNRWVLVLTMLFSSMALASTKQLECKQTTDKGVEQMIYATVDDASDKAEVESFALSASCAKDRSCGVEVYVKDVLPSVIRLTRTMRAGSMATYTTVVEVNRTTLAITTRTKLVSSVGDTETTAHGTCKLELDKTRKVL